MTKIPDMPAIIIDTREQKPYPFEGAERSALNAGDYSLKGFENKIAIERKTKSDAYSSLSGRRDENSTRSRRDRFKDEFFRLSNYDYAAVVIECSLPSFLIPPKRSKLNPRSAISTLISWSIRYDVHICWASDRLHGIAMVHSMLRLFWRNHNLNRVNNETRS